MNELTFKPARSVALYNSRLIIAEGDDDFFDSHGISCDDPNNPFIPEYQIDGYALVKLIDGFEIDYNNQKLQDNIFDDVKNRFSHLNRVYGDRIVKLSIAENGYGGLQIKMDFECIHSGEEHYSELMSYFGPYSIRWRND